MKTIAFLPLVSCLRLPVNPYSGSIVPEEIINQYEPKMQEQREYLIRASDPNYVPPDMGVFPAVSKKGKASAPNNRFEAIKIELPLAPPLIDHIPIESGSKESGRLGGKNLVGLDQLKAKKDCVIYSLGVSGNSKFEEIMATEYGCEVHGFDCTVPEGLASVRNKHFKFHDWCIGKNNGALTTVLNHETKNGAPSKNMVFKTLSESMEELGHNSMDVLKFDIEGFEWQLFQDELLQGKILPAQISFEIHTKGAKPWTVPQALTDNHGNYEVNNVFLKLHKLGYRVVSKELNRHDHACAEFVLVRV